MRSTGDDTINIERIIHAPLKDVWKAWTEPSIILNWFGSDPDGKGLNAELEVVPGGRFEITFTNADGTEHTCFGVYIEVQICSRLSFTWTWKNEPGVESVVTVLLTAFNDLTRMQFEHAHVGTKSAHNYLEGWQTTFEKLERTLKSQ
jgi:uncharacterized protein YndB with AHSA1/START domain